MRRMLSAKSAVFFEFQFIRRCPFVFCRGIISSLTLGTCKRNKYSHRKTPLCYAIISLTTPAPTVLPPSRIAKRSSFSIAIGVISSALMVILSPGIIISTPSGRFSIPVTSVVLK